MALNANAAKLCVARVLAAKQIQRLNHLAQIGARVAQSFDEADEQEMSPMDLAAKRVFMDMEQNGHRNRITETITCLRTVENRINSLTLDEITDDVVLEIVRSLQTALDKMDALFAAAKVAEKKLKLAAAECN